MTIPRCQCPRCRRDRWAEAIVGCSNCHAAAGVACHSLYRSGYVGGYHGSHAPRRRLAATVLVIARALAPARYHQDQRVRVLECASHYPHHEGRTGAVEIERADPGEGRVMVRLDGGYQDRLGGELCTATRLEVTPE